MNWFRAPSGQDWFSVGRTSTFPNIGMDENTEDFKKVCKAFHVPPGDSSKAAEIGRPGASYDDVGEEGKLHEQVIVFRYKGKFHAIDHVRAHSLFP
jgi:nitrite reductase/ring-hydroxylating ferredoxin subunit